ncbi:MAG: thioredoxin family protein [Fusobacteriaceae bacterium]
MEKILLTSKTCIHCSTAKNILKDTPDLVIKDVKENSELVAKYGIKSVPTLVTICKCEGIKTYIGVDQIQDFVNESQKKTCSL